LVRDPRDVVSSAMRSGGASFDESLQSAQSTARRISEIKAAEDDVHFVRYEDFVLRRHETIDALFAFIGMAPPPYDEAGMCALFGLHGTSSSPEASVSRWRHDLTAEQSASCAANFASFIELFDYNR
jgi:hypothetical protein